MKQLEKGPVVPNTQKNTVWALNTFSEWRDERNQSATDSAEFCPTNLFTEPEAEKLNYWLSRFVTEARRKDGGPYPSRTIYMLLSGLLRYGRSLSKVFPNFMDRGDTRFSELAGVCDSISKQLRKEGVGASIKHSAVITPEEEDLLWEKGILGIYAPKPLVRAVFSYVGKEFCLRGGQEQRMLKPSQFVREKKPNRYTFTQNGSKNHQGGFGTLNDSNKIVTIYSSAKVESGEGDIVHYLRDVVYLLDLYFSKIPSPPEQMDYMYLQPKSQVPVNPSEPWFYSKPIGKNTLGNMVSTMCKEAGISEKKTNHSLRATGATAMFAANVPEKMIKEVTGHKSSKALALYERPTVPQKQALSNVLMGGKDTGPFIAEVQKMRQEQKKQFSKEPVTPNVTSGPFSPLFSGLTNCTINICPQNLTIGGSTVINHSPIHSERQVLEEFDSIVSETDYQY